MKKVVLFASMLCLSTIVFSQSESSIPERKVRFGFNLGANYSNLQTKETLPANAQIINGVGGSFGVFMDYSISKHLIFSPKTELSFNNSSVEFSNGENSVSSYDIFPVCLDFMTHMLYKIGNGKITPYLLAGPNFKLPLSNKPKTSSDFKTNSDFAIDFGIGFENRTRYFIYAPELRYSFGLLNINENPSLQSLNYNKISLILNFK
jgi:hypothetical protein